MNQSDGIVVTTDIEMVGHSVHAQISARYVRLMQTTHSFAHSFSIKDKLTDKHIESFRGKTVMFSSWEFGKTYLMEHKYGYMYVSTNDMVGGGFGSVDLISPSKRELNEFVELIAPLLPQKETVKPSDPSVTVNFWTTMQGMGRIVPRKLAVSPWAEVEKNYPSATRSSMNALVKDFKAESGKLLLWHGEPGTGKTWALRALISEWRQWATPNYVVDPERMFGSDSNYLLQVILQPEQIEAQAGVRRARKSKQWQLLILEDAGELLSQDAKSRAGQGFSRLLNVTDGLIGQGLQLMILITTNEPLSKLHPAVSRPGRTAAEIEFNSFSREESLNWLKERNFKFGNGQVSSHTLAELYAMISGREVKSEVALGFGR